ncbi:MAG TPA: kelch repeat-containing protein, partial [Candidatus Udaeobacter sp.]|nr:kelch repeat-containing protein [Candidatus Udaeobacter sp.]
MNLNKTQLTKNRNIKAENISQSAAGLGIRTIIKHHFKLFIRSQICLALSAAMLNTTNASQPLPDNPTTGSDMTVPDAGRWRPTGNLQTARDIHTATLLPNGLVLVAGGLNTLSVESRTAELYDPASGTW